MLIRSRSTLGAFVRSNLGAKGLSDLALLGDGQGDAAMNIFATTTTRTPISAFYGTRSDSPYGVMQSLNTRNNANSSTTQYVGKRERTGAGGLPQNAGIDRSRVGLSFNMPDLTGLLYAYLDIELYDWKNAIETFIPQIWVSSFDNSNINSNWFSNWNIFGADGVYGTSGQQRFNLQVSAITPRSLGVLSIVIGENKELLDFGVGTTNINNQFSSFAVNLSNCVLTLGF